MAQKTCVLGATLCHDHDELFLIEPFSQEFGMDPSGFEPEAPRSFVIIIVLMKLFGKVSCKADALPG